MFRMLRYFSIASLLSILIAATALTLLYRKVAMNNIVRLGEINNIALSQAELNSVRPQLVRYLASTTPSAGGHAYIFPLVEGLDAALQALMNNTTVIRVNLFGQDGHVAFSTDPALIGLHEGRNPGFVAAIGGKTFSKLVYRDTFNLFDRVTAEDNLVQTYIPVRQTPTSPIVGVFEIYTDSNLLVSQAEHTVVIILLGVAAICLLLYLALLLIVQRADTIIAAQQQAIRERTQTLETLSAQLLASEENEKKRIAIELQEGIAQTLAAIKVNVEKTCLLDPQRRQDGSETLTDLVPLIQCAIQDVRELAMDLRPSSLDDLGLVPTLAWFFREFQAIYPDIHIERRIEITDQDLPPPLKPIIYRIVHEALHYIAKHMHADAAVVGLGKTANAIELTIAHNRAATAPDTCGTPDIGAIRADGMTPLRQRAVLSGGSFAVDDDAQGGTRIRAWWPR